MSLIQMDDDENVVTVTLNDPKRRNAMSLPMAKEFRRAVTELMDRPKLRGVLITGAGSAFSAGGDLEMLEQKAKLDQVTNQRLMIDFYESFLCILGLPVPVVAAVNGHAIGAGLAVALACDARIASADAKFGLTFAKLALHPGMASTLFLPRIVGHTVASDLLLSGRVFTANDARQWGLIANVVDPGEVMQVARQEIERFAAAGNAATSGILATLRPSQAELKATMEREASQQSENYARAEFAERIALAQKRSS